MRGSPKQFSIKRRDPVSITNARVKSILSYVIFCYQELASSKKTYSRNWIATNTVHSLEDYLKMELVDSFLIPNKHHIQQKISQLEQINFSYETQKRYQDTKGVERVDKIDIFINKIGLQKAWKIADEHLYLAIECKRIGALHDNTAYLGDILKFCERSHIQNRIPFEGMIAFVENKKISVASIADDLNTRLKTSTKIITKKFLSLESLMKGFTGSFGSEHFRINQKHTFFIYHLYLDYSNVVLS